MSPPPVTIKPSIPSNEKFGLLYCGGNITAWASNLLHNFINSALKTAQGIIPGDICVSFIPVDIPIVKLVNFYSSSMWNIVCTSTHTFMGRLDTPTADLVAFDSKYSPSLSVNPFRTVGCSV